MPPVIFVDRMATIAETGDRPPPDDAQVETFKIAKVVEANPRDKTITSDFVKWLTFVLTQALFPLLRMFQLSEVLLYLWFLFVSAGGVGAGMNPKLFAFGQLLDLFVTDLIVALAGSLSVTTRDRDGPSIWIAEGDGVPGVDLIITTCKEPVDIIMDTIYACLDIDWPKSKLRVIVSDDGKDAALEKALGPLRAMHANLLYHTRTRPAGVHHGFKAGNMNDTMKWLEDKGDGPNPWIFNLDCDMIPDREVLRVLMGAALRDPKVGLATIPQDFYNIPLNDPLHENMEMQHQRDQLVRGAHNAAWCPGSGFVYSREAWDRVGGFQETSMCDDVFFGWTLNGAGYKTVHVNACHQSGLQPDTFQDHIKQRRRWYVGSMRNCVHLGLGIRHPAFKGMTWMQFLFAVNQMPKCYLGTLFKGIVAILNLTCLVRGILYMDSIVNVGSHHIARILYAFAFHRIAGLIFDGFGALTYGHNVRRHKVVIVWQGLHLFKSCVDEYLPSWLGGYKLGFITTGVKSGKLILTERDAAVRPGRGIRLSIGHQAERVMWHLVYFVVVAVLVLWNSHYIIWSSRIWSISLFWLITGPLFPGLGLENVFTHLSPIWYFVNPPTMPTRRQLMSFDERTGGFRPLPEHRGVRYNKWMWIWEGLNIAGVIWAAVAFLFVYEGVDGRLVKRLPTPSNENLARLVLEIIPGMGIGLGIMLVTLVLANKVTARRLAAAEAKRKDA